jgi:predicted acylesterase/phospholipase RssA
LVEEEKGILKKAVNKVKSKFEGPNLIEIIAQSTDIMESRITELSIEGTDVLIIPFGIKDINTLDFDEAELLIKGGIMAALINIPRIKEVGSHERKIKRNKIIKESRHETFF